MARCWNWRDNGALEASVRKGVWVRIPPWPLLIIRLLHWTYWPTSNEVLICVGCRGWKEFKKLDFKQKETYINGLVAQLAEANGSNPL